MRLIRVLHLSGTSGQGGSETVLALLATKARLYGIQPSVGLMTGGWLADHLNDSGIATYYFQKSRVLDCRLLRELTGSVWALKPDVVHCHGAPMSIYGCLASRLARVPCVAHVHGLSPDLDRPRRRLIYRIVWCTAARIVAVSDHVAGELLAMGAPPSKIRAIPNGVDVDEYRWEGKRDTAKRTFGFPAGTPVVGMVSRLYSVKGVDLALEAFSRIVKRMPDAQLLIAGRGPERHTLELRVRQLRLDDHVRFLCHVATVPQLLSATDVVLVTSRSEAFSLSSVEAMAAGRPVVAWRHEGPAEIVVDGETGTLVPPFDTTALANACLDLLSDPIGARARGLAGRERAERLYSLETMLCKWQNLYLELAGSPMGKVGSGVRGTPRL